MAETLQERLRAVSPIGRGDGNIFTRAADHIDQLEAELAAREARRVEILDWLQDEIGTAFDCECGWSSYHAFNNECQNCGADFPPLHMLAFKLHATHPSEAPALDGEKA